MLQGHERILYRVPGTLKIQDIDRDGRVLLVHELIWAGILAHVPGEQGERELGRLDWSIGRKLSGDGKWLLFDESGDAPGEQGWIYLRRTDGTPPVLLGEGTYCDLSPDGKWVAAAPSDYSGQINLLPTGAGESRKLQVAGLKIYRVMWLPDQQHVVISASDASKTLRGYVVDLKTAAARAFTPEGVKLHPAVSPDGKFVAGVAADRRIYYSPWTAARRGASKQTLTSAFWAGRPIRSRCTSPPLERQKLAFTRWTLLPATGSSSAPSRRWTRPA